MYGDERKHGDMSCFFFFFPPMYRFFGAERRREKEGEIGKDGWLGVGWGLGRVGIIRWMGRDG